MELSVLSSLEESNNLLLENELVSSFSFIKAKDSKEEELSFVSEVICSKFLKFKFFQYY